MELAHFPVEPPLEIARTVACGEAPDPVRIAAPFQPVDGAPRPIDEGRAAAILEIVEASLAHDGITDAAKVDPRVAVLMSEQRPETDVPSRTLAAPELWVARRPLLPQVRRSRVRRRAERQDVDEHPFIVADPVGGNEFASFRVPAHGHCLAAVAAEEIPVGAPIERVRKLPDLALARIVAVIILPGKERAHEEDRGIDARQLDVAKALAVLHVEEVVEEALVAARAALAGALRGVPEEAQSSQREIARVGS